MSDRKKPKSGDYEIGYGKPPKHSQFVPGQSGYKGRKKKVLEPIAEMVARVRDEVHKVGNGSMTSLELAVRQVINQTIKSGKPRDLKVLFDVLDTHGAMPEYDRYAEARDGADEALRKIFSHFDKTFDVTPEMRERMDRNQATRERGDEEEVEHVMSCDHCGPALRQRWSARDYQGRTEDSCRTQLHKLVLEARARRDAKDD